MVTRSKAAAVAAFCVIAAYSPHAFAWGASAHRMIAGLTAQSLPLEVPEFLRSPEAARQIGEVARDPDRPLGAGEPYDSAFQSAHHVDVGDDLKIARGPALSALPATRELYDTALRAAGTNQYRTGYLPYAIMEASQLLARDLAYWRADIAGAKHADTPAERTFFLKDQYMREGLTIRDLGYLAHFVAEGAEPLNVSVHSDGWGNYPNPQGFTAAKGVRARFEARFVRTRILGKDIAPRIAPYRDCRCAIARRTSDYLAATQKEVATLYGIEKSNGFEPASEAGKTFVVSRIAAATSELRDLIVDAWRLSADVSVGTPPIPVRDIESGRTNPYDSLRGTD